MDRIPPFKHPLPVVVRVFFKSTECVCPCISVLRRFRFRNGVCTSHFPDAGLGMLGHTGMGKGLLSAPLRNDGGAPSKGGARGAGCAPLCRGRACWWRCCKMGRTGLSPGPKRRRLRCFLHVLLVLACPCVSVIRRGPRRSTKASSSAGSARRSETAPEKGKEHP